LIQADRADEDRIVEAPAMIRHGGTYVLFYSGNAYNSGRYFGNYATADACAISSSNTQGSCSTSTRSTTGIKIRVGRTGCTPMGRIFWSYTHSPSAPRRAMFVAVME
jgi:hypothetical protein